MFLIFVRVFHIFSVNKQRMVVAHGVAVPKRRDVVELRKSRLSYALAKKLEKCGKVIVLARRPGVIKGKVNHYLVSFGACSRSREKRYPCKKKKGERPTSRPSGCTWNLCGYKPIGQSL